MNSEFAERYKSLPTDQLLRIVHVDFASFRPEAVDAARAELATRDDQPKDDDLSERLSNLGPELASPQYVLEDRALRLIPLLLPAVGFWIAIFQWAKGRNERARLTWTWWFYGVLLHLALALIAVVLNSG